MIGHLTIEKANLNISYMLASLKILSDAGGELSREEFVRKMAEFMGALPRLDGGVENRAPYNKTKFDRYFGFIDVRQNGNLLLTPRGALLVDLIVRKENEVEATAIYEIDKSYRYKAQELFLDSCCFDPFGSYNCGAETSNSDIEPPRLILKSVDVLGEMSKWELGYVLWGMDAGIFDSYDAALQRVKSNQEEPTYDYCALIDNWGKTNFVRDFKMVDLFCDENVGILEETESGTYCLAKLLSDEARRRIKGMNPISAPIQMFLKSCYSHEKTMSWVRNAVLGRIANPSLIFECNMTSSAPLRQKVVADAISEAYSRRRTGNGSTHQNSTVTLIITGLTRGVADIDSMFEGFSSSFARLDDFKSDKHGWSARPGQDADLYELLVARDDFARRLGQNNIVLPSNLNIIGVK